MTLHLSNFNILELCRTWEQINAEDSQIVCKNKYPIMNLKEKAQVMYFWKYLNSLIRKEFNDDPYVYSRPNRQEQKKVWMGYSDRKKIIMMLLYTLKQLVVNRQDILIRDLKEEIQANENFWGSFALRWKYLIAIAYKTNWDWREFTKEAEPRIKELWSIEGILKEKGMKKSLDKLLYKMFWPWKHRYTHIQSWFKTERTVCVEYIEEYLMVLDGPEEVRFRYKHKEEKVEWHKLKEIGGRGDGLSNPVSGIARV
jgi:hypothetical protein